MFEAFFIFLKFMVSALPELRVSDRKKAAKALLGVYREVVDLVQNGSQILALMESRQGQLLFDEPDQVQKQLKSLLLDQESRIKKLKSVLKANRVETILSVKLPEIHPILLQLVKEKGNQIVFYLEAFDPNDPDRFSPETSEAALTDPLPPSNFGIDDELLSVPYIEEIKKAKSKLRSIKKLAERLRQFLASEFKVEELT